MEEVRDDTEGIKAAEVSVAAREKNQLFSRKLFWYNRNGKGRREESGFQTAVACLKSQHLYVHIKNENQIGIFK